MVPLVTWVCVLGESVLVLYERKPKIEIGGLCKDWCFSSQHRGRWGLSSGEAYLEQRAREGARRWPGRAGGRAGMMVVRSTLTLSYLYLLRPPQITKTLGSALPASAPTDARLPPERLPAPHNATLASQARPSPSSPTIAGSTFKPTTRHADHSRKKTSVGTLHTRSKEGSVPIGGAPPISIDADCPGRRNKPLAAALTRCAVQKSTAYTPRSLHGQAITPVPDARHASLQWRIFALLQPPRRARTTVLACSAPLFLIARAHLRNAVGGSGSERRHTHSPREAFLPQSAAAALTNVPIACRCGPERGPCHAYGTSTDSARGERGPAARAFWYRQWARPEMGLRECRLMGRAAYSFKLRRGLSSAQQRARLIPENVPGPHDRVSGSTAEFRSHAVICSSFAPAIMGCAGDRRALDK
ncbi:hypothetical protein BC628DRAFT_532457 [Trametes gibbosa]|nr:hypothetical protein BC628DRAFT_532457 [Trametes gibbosa]